MAKYDKYEPMGGGFRALLAADKVATSKTGNGNPIGVGLDSQGRVVPGAGNTGILGVMATTTNKVAGDVVDVMTDGECVEMASLTAGTVITANTTTGALGSTAADASNTRIGHTVSAKHLIVRARR